jgi:hypothetical protein
MQQRSRSCGAAGIDSSLTAAKPIRTTDQRSRTRSVTEAARTICCWTKGSVGVNRTNRQRTIDIGKGSQKVTLGFGEPRSLTARPIGG